MKKKMNPKDILVPAVMLLVICLVTTVLLALTNSVTKTKIAQNAADKETSSRAEVLPDATQFSEVTVDEEKGVTYCEGKNEAGESVGYVFTSSAKGYGGDVTVMTGVGSDGKITGVTILSHGETPGLGANSTKPEFRDRFIGKSGELVVNKTSNDGQNVQAITAATITSKAVVAAVNNALSVFSEVSGGAENG